MKEMLNKAFVSAVVVTFVSAVVINLYWLFIDTEPPTIQNSVATFNVSGEPATTFHPGDVMVIRRDFCVIDDGEAVFTRFLIRTDGSEIYFLPSGPQHLTLGCRKASNEVEIPTHIGAGTYDYRVTISFQNNPLTVTEQTMTMPRITIVPKQ